jgi:hypothetical protein
MDNAACKDLCQEGMPKGNGHGHGRSGHHLERLVAKSKTLAGLVRADNTWLDRANSARELRPGVLRAGKKITATASR